MNYFLILALSFYSLTAVAQKVKGVVRDENGEAVEYVNVGIVNGTIGTITDDEGCFVLTLNDSLDNRVIRFSRLGFVPYERRVKEFKHNFSGVVTMKRDVLKFEDINVMAVGTKNASHREAIVNRRGVRIPAGVLALQENPKITMNWVSDPKMGYQYGVIVESEKKYIPQRMEIPIADCLSDTVLFRVNIYDIDSCGSVSKLLNRDEIFFKVKRKLAKNSYTVDLMSQALTLKGRQFFAIEVVAYSYPLKYNETIITFPLFSAPSYFRKSSQGAFEKFSNNLGIKVWALIEK